MPPACCSPGGVARAAATAAATSSRMRPRTAASERGAGPAVGGANGAEGWDVPASSVMVKTGAMSAKKRRASTARTTGSQTVTLPPDGLRQRPPLSRCLERTAYCLSACLLAGLCLMPRGRLLTAHAHALRNNDWGSAHAAPCQPIAMCLMPRGRLLTTHAHALRNNDWGRHTPPPASQLPCPPLTLLN